MAIAAATAEFCSKTAEMPVASVLLSLYRFLILHAHPLIINSCSTGYRSFMSA